MAKSVDDRGKRGPLARRDDGAHCGYVTDGKQASRDASGAPRSTQPMDASAQRKREWRV